MASSEGSVPGHKPIWKQSADQGAGGRRKLDMTMSFLPFGWDKHTKAGVC